MTNILQMQEILKSIPDQRLMQEMQQPTGRAPQYLVMTEIQRRKKVRDEYQGQMQDQQTTVAEDMVMEPAPQQPPMAPAGMPPQMSQGMPPQMQPPMAAAQPPMNMEGGGALYMQEGSKASQYFGAVDLNRLVSLVEAEAGNQDLAGRRAVAAVILNRTLSDQFPDTIQAVAEQRTPGGSYQFSPLINVGGDIDKLPAGSAGTRAAVLDLLSDFNNKNPVGDALYFQNPEISGMIFPALRGNYDDGKRNNKPFPDGVTKIGDHVFSTRYGNEKAPEFEPVAFRVEDNALTSVDRKRLGTDEALKITGAGEEVIMAESEPAPVPPSSFRGGIAGIPEKIDQRTGGFRGPSLAETLQQAPLPQEQLVGGLDAFIPDRRFTTKSGAQVKAETLAGLQSPDTNLPVELYDAAALAGSGLPIGEVPPPAPRPDVVKRMGDIAAATNAAQMAEDPLVAFGGLGATGSQATPFVPDPNVVKRLQDMAAATNAAQSASPDFSLPVAGYDAAASADLGSSPRSSATLRRKERRPAAAPDPLAKLREFASNTVDFLRSGAPSPAMSAQPDYSLDVAGYDPASDLAAAIPGNVDEFGEFNVKPRFETASIDPPSGAAAPPAATQAANLTSTPAGLYENLDPKAYSDPSAGKEVVAGVQSVRDAAAASGAGTTTAAAPTGGMADLLAQLQAGRDDAKAMGLLTAGLGIMQQASQPGATLLSSIPGAAAGVKQYSADKANLAKQQLALATLANQQRATDIAAQKAGQLPKYQAIRENLRAAIYNDPTQRDKYFDKAGKPNAAFEELVISKTRTLPDPSLTRARLESAANKYADSKAGLAEASRIREELKKKNPTMSEADAFKRASEILRRRFLYGNNSTVPSAGVQSVVRGADGKLSVAPAG